MPDEDDQIILEAIMTEGWLDGYDRERDFPPPETLEMGSKEQHLFQSNLLMKRKRNGAHKYKLVGLEREKETNRTSKSTIPKRKWKCPRRRLLPTNDERKTTNLVGAELGRKMKTTNTAMSKTKAVPLPLNKEEEASDLSGTADDKNPAEKTDRDPNLDRAGQVEAWKHGRRETCKN